MSVDRGKRKWLTDQLSPPPILDIHAHGDDPMTQRDPQQLANAQKKIPNQSIVNLRPLEVYRMTGLGHVLDLRVWHHWRKRVRQKRRIIPVFTTGNKERRHRQAAQYVSRPRCNREKAFAQFSSIECRAGIGDLVIMVMQ